MTTLRDELRTLPHEGDTDGWRPRHYDPADPTQWEALRDLVRGGRVWTLHDEIEDQLSELAETRLPRPRDAGERPRVVQTLLAGRPADRYGRWVYYPWSGRLVHVLPEAELRELRTSRNRYKITAAEQEQLRALKVGVVGLSVGQATAVTLALEEVGGEFRLADFDRLSLSNVNRLRAGMHELGVNKAVITAREIFEINPYARVRLYTGGLDDANLEAFLTEGGKLDLLFEECDDLFMKVLLRERARAHRIPTLMETSDRGLIDVERFDLEPDRPLLHGLIGDVRAEELRGLPTADKVPFVLDILGTTTLSERFSGTLYEIDRSVRTWPQLASGVALGGALNTDAARRIALGTFTESGRYYVDLEQAVANGRSTTPHPSPPLPRKPVPDPEPLRASAGKLGESELRELARFGTLAPSGGNVQPWRFEATRNALRIYIDPHRSGSILDFEKRGTTLAIAAAAENIRIAAAALGLGTRVTPYPDPEQPLLGAEIIFGGEPERGLAALVEPTRLRVTNRRRAPQQKITSQQLAAIQSAAEQCGAHAHLVTDRAALDEIGVILGLGDRLRFTNPKLREEMQWEVRWTEEEVARLDGLDARSLEASPTDLAAMRLALSGAGLDLVKRLGLGSALTEGAAKAMTGASGALLVTAEGHGTAAHFAGGRAVERIWIAGQAAGVAMQPYTAFLYLIFRMESGDVSPFEPAEARLLADLRARLRRVMPVGRNETEIMLLRLAHAPPPTVRSLRMPVERVFSFR